MTIGVFGRGRLGSAIALAAGDALRWNVGREEPPQERVDCAIEASSGKAVERRLGWALEQRTPLVIGSTGWSIADLAERVGERIGVVVAPNFSLTVALFARLTRVVARFAAGDPARDPYLVEHHHARKHDAPSGTARMLATAILDECPRKERWRIVAEGALAPEELSLAVVRAGTTYSTHVVGVDAPGEVLELRHEARSAAPFAAGALAAARWIAARRGVFTMADVARDEFAPLFRGFEA